MMQFTCNVATFANAFNTVARVVGTKGGRFQSVRADLSEGVLTLTGTDLEHTITQNIEIENGVDGVALFPKDKFGDILKTCDNDDEIQINYKDHVNIKIGS